MFIARQVMYVHSTSRNRVYVYRGEGAGWRSVSSTAESLQRLLPDCYQVSTITAAELLSGAWAEHAAMLVMPGGADLPYCKHLNGLGNALIRRFVHSGGSYLGLCAGAYYAAARVDFEPGTPLQVVGDRELAFFPGIARGAAYPGFDYQTEAGAVAAGLQFAVPIELAEQQQQQQDSFEQQLAPSTAPAHGLCNGGSTWQHTFDYCNGGPYFVTGQGEHDLSAMPGVEVLARYSALTRRDMQQQQQQGTRQAHNSMCLQHQQGAQQASAQHVPPPGDQQSRVWQAAAAVRCSVGLGVAVLCGTHPELEPHWLDVCGRAWERAAAATQATPGAAQHGSVTGAARQASRNASSCEHAEARLSGAVASSSTQLGVQRRVAWAATEASCSLSQPGSMQTCKDAQLVLHTQILRNTLAACQQQRDLFLSCLLYKALGHREPKV